MCAICGPFEGFSSSPSTEAALRKLLMEERDKTAKLSAELEDVKKERDRWLRRMQMLERRLQLVFDAIDSRKEV